VHALAAKAATLALSALMSPAGGFHGHYHHGRPARFRVGAAVGDFTPPPSGQAPAGYEPVGCPAPSAYNGPRQFAFEEPYADLQHEGHYQGPPDPTSPSSASPGDPYSDCNGNGRWDGNLLGGGSHTPRFYDHVADPVTARAMVVSNGRQTIGVEVVDQEGLFNVYQQQIRDKVAADGYRLDGIFISATHDESAPDSLGLGGVTATTSGVNNIWLRYFIDRSASAIEQAYRAMRPAEIRYTEVFEPPNLRQCWSSYPYVDDQHMPVLEAVSRNGKAIATLVSVSQHAETLGFNHGTPTLEAQNTWISADWVHFFRSTLERRLGGVGIEMAGAVGSVESPEVYSQRISRTPQQEIAADHPAGCHTLFRAGGQTDKAGKLHVPLGYDGETRAWGEQMASPVIRALRKGAYYNSRSLALWGQRSEICVPLENELFTVAASLGVFANRPGYNADCSQANPVLSSGSTSGTSLRSEVAAFRIGDGEFISIPGEIFPFTLVRGFLGPQDMPNSAYPLPAWPLPHMHARFRFIDGLAEDMIGYIFPRGNAVGIPSSSNPSPSDTDRFGCGHSDDAESASSRSGDIVNAALVALLDRHGRPERIATGRYVLPGGKLSRDPLGGPELKCSSDTTFTSAGHAATRVQLTGGKRIKPRAWMSLSGLPQKHPDRDTRGYFDRRGRRVWLDVFS
jgi:hypothetical protein